MPVSNVIVVGELYGGSHEAQMLVHSVSSASSRADLAPAHSAFFVFRCANVSDLRICLLSPAIEQAGPASLVSLVKTPNRRVCIFVFVSMGVAQSSCCSMIWVDGWE